MEENRAQFLIMVGEIGRQARLAGLPIEIVTRDDESLFGIPKPHEATDTDTEFDHTGLTPHFTVGDVTVGLDDVVAVRISSP